MSSVAVPARSARISASYAWEVAKRTTERDREIARLLYRQKILTTEQMRLLFFSSLRRCQDRLLWLHRHRVIDRFYPSGPFALGKPQAHWLLDEVGAYLVAARLGRERKSLAWDRQQDFHAHAQLAHRLETNAFACALIAATADEPELWVSEWGLAWEAIARHWQKPPYEMVRPDASITLSRSFGLIAIALEWDRATEPMATLISKIERYEATLKDAHTAPRINVCFVVPGSRRSERLLGEGWEPAERAPRARFWVTTATELQRLGALGEIWHCLDHEDRAFSIAEFETLTGAETFPREQALGRRWQAPMPERWVALSPLRATLRSGAGSGLLEGQAEDDEQREEPRP